MIGTEDGRRNQARDKARVLLMAALYLGPQRIVLPVVVHVEKPSKWCAYSKTEQ